MVNKIFIIVTLVLILGSTSNARVQMSLWESTIPASEEIHRKTLVMEIKGLAAGLNFISACKFSVILLNHCLNNVDHQST